MKNSLTRILLVSLFAFCLLLSACGAQAPAAAPETPAPTPEAVEEAPAEPSAPETALDTDLPVRVMTLNGTTGFGMAGLIAEHSAGGTALNYSFAVDTDASNVTAALVNGDCDIAALPTNAASAQASATFCSRSSTPAAFSTS